MNIETERMVIREFVPEDVGDLHEILGDDETMKLCEPAYSHEKTQKFLEEFCIGRKGALAAVQKESGNDTVKSVKLMEKLGMVCEGVQWSQVKDNAGNRADLYLYGILRS